MVVVFNVEIGVLWGGVSIFVSIDVGVTGVFGGSGCCGEGDDDCVAIDIVDGEKEEDEVEVDDE